MLVSKPPEVKIQQFLGLPQIWDRSLSLTMCCQDLYLGLLIPPPARGDYWSALPGLQSHTLTHTPHQGVHVVRITMLQIGNIYVKQIESRRE